MMKYPCLYLLRTSIWGAASWHLQPRKPRSITLVSFRDVRIFEVLLIYLDINSDPIFFIFFLSKARPDILITSLIKNQAQRILERYSMESFSVWPFFKLELNPYQLAKAVLTYQSHSKRIE